MTNDELEDHIRLLHRRVTIMGKMIDAMHDTLMFSPPAGHTAMFMDAVEDELESMREDIDTTVTGLNRVRADRPDTGRTIAEVSERVLHLDDMPMSTTTTTNFNPHFKLRDIDDDI